jgi:hypothetical protein
MTGYHAMDVNSYVAVKGCGMELGRQLHMA